MIKVLYIDDEIDRPGRDAQKVKELLELSHEFVCELELPPKNFAELPSDLPDALLVDFDLGAANANHEFVSYFGSTLAAEMRMRHQACPIVLVTRPQIMSAWNTQILEKSIDVDLILFKDAINQQPDVERAKIVALIEGFQSLVEIQGQEWEKVIGLMGATEDESRSLRESAPPIESKLWNIPQTARWIRNVIMRFPGILYDELYASARLGVSLASFREDNVQDYLRSSQYGGVLSSYAPRWWRDRLMNQAKELMFSHQLEGSIAEHFATAFESETGLRLDPAICIYDESPIADWVCYILQMPVKLQNSLPYYPDNRPPVMEQARVSLKAIKEDNRFDETLVDADSFEVIEQLWG